MGDKEKQAFDFGLHIRMLRKKYNWSQDELGRRLGVTKQTVYQYEANIQTPPFEKVKRLAEIFGVSLDYLVGWDHDPVLRLHGLTEEQHIALFRFIEAFTGKKPE